MKELAILQSEQDHHLSIVQQVSKKVEVVHFKLNTNRGDLTLKAQKSPKGAKRYPTTTETRVKTTVNKAVEAFDICFTSIALTHWKS
jgi:hypothetical protein